MATVSNNIPNWHYLASIMPESKCPVCSGRGKWRLKTTNAVVRCPNCQGRMMLAQIRRGPGGADLRTFECLKCEHVQKMLVEDPLKSANTGWMAGGLRPPK